MNIRIILFVALAMMSQVWSASDFKSWSFGHDSVQSYLFFVHAIKHDSSDDIDKRITAFCEELKASF